MMEKGAKGTVLVTGGYRGLGAMLALKMAADGYRVIAAGRRTDSVPEGVEALPLRLEDEGSIREAARLLEGRPIDILIHNAAVRGATDGLDAVTTEDFIETMRVNALAPLLLTRALLPNLRAGHRKIIAMISSRAGSNSEGHRDNPDGDYAYRCSKAALNMATTKLAADLHPDGIAVMAFHPGWVRTDMGGEEADLTVEESAHGLVALICRAGMADTASFRTHDGQPVGW